MKCIKTLIILLFPNGGYQYIVFERFRKIYQRNFGNNDNLYNYLFPNTDTSGRKIDGKFIKHSLLNYLNMNEYYKMVGEYYDTDALDFDKRYWQNPILQKNKTRYKRKSKKYSF